MSIPENSKGLFALFLLLFFSVEAFSQSFFGAGQFSAEQQNGIWNDGFSPAQRCPSCLADTSFKFRIAAGVRDHYLIRSLHSQNLAISIRKKDTFFNTEWDFARVSVYSENRLAFSLTRSFGPRWKAGMALGNTMVNVSEIRMRNYFWFIRSSVLFRIKDNLDLVAQLLFSHAPGNLFYRQTVQNSFGLKYRINNQFALSGESVLGTGKNQIYFAAYYQVVSRVRIRGGICVESCWIPDGGVLFEIHKGINLEVGARVHPDLGTAFSCQCKWKIA